MKNIKDFLLRKWNTVKIKNEDPFFEKIDEEHILNIYRKNNIGKPNYIQFVLWKKCNLECKYCHVKAWPKEIPAKDNMIPYQALASLLEQQGIKSLLIEFQGGEPLLNIELIDKIIQEYQKRFSLNIIITTNWTLFSEKIINFFKKYNNIYLNISFDWTVNIHNKNRNNTWKIVLENIKKFQEIGLKNPITFIGTLNHNFLDIKPLELIQFLKENNMLNRYLLRPVAGVWRWNANDEDYDKLLTYFKEYISAIYKEGDIDILSEQLLNAMTNKMVISEFDFFQPYKTISMDNDGNLFFNDYERSLNDNTFWKSLNNVLNIFSLEDFYKIDSVQKEIDKFYKLNKNRLLVLPLYILKDKKLVEFYDNLLKLLIFTNE